MSDEETWSEDVCTCGHVNSQHANGVGRCASCAANASWESNKSLPVCPRYQWNRKERKRTW